MYEGGMQLVNKVVFQPIRYSKPKSALLSPRLLPDPQHLLPGGHHEASRTTDPSSPAGASRPSSVTSHLNRPMAWLTFLLPVILRSGT